MLFTVNGQQSVVNLAVRQCLLEFLDAFVGDLSVSEAQPFEAGQTFEVV